MNTAEILQGDCLEVLGQLQDESVQCCVTSPPYFGLRDYGVDGQIGLEETPDAYVAKLVAVFREVRRVLKKDGTLWLNLGDSYTGGGCAPRDPERWPKQSRNDHVARHRKKQTSLETKNLIGIPWRVAFALQADGWFLRQDIIWSKPNPMPESVKDRCTKAHEYIFLLSKSAKYFYDAEAIAEPVAESTIQRVSQDVDNQKGSVDAQHRTKSGNVYAGGATRNKRSVWTFATCPFKEAHFATFPMELPELCIKAGSQERDTVLDPFNGSGTTGLVACALNRNYIGIELNKHYVEMSKTRIEQASPLFTEVRA